MNDTECEAYIEKHFIGENDGAFEEVLDDALNEDVINREEYNFAWEYITHLDKYDREFVMWIAAVGSRRAYY